MFLVAPAFCAAAVALAQNRSQAQQFQETITIRWMEDKGDYPAAIRLFEETSWARTESKMYRSGFPEARELTL